MGLKSIIGFRPIPVTILTLITYVTLFSAVLWIDRRPPKVASESELNHWGVSVDEAWADLQTITRVFHPYNSRQNDDVRKFLLDRIQGILSDNGVGGFETDEYADENNRFSGTVELINDGASSTPGSNVTFAGSADGNLTVYFEGTNIIIYIHGERPASELSPVLVNAHYDSVSTGYGATDDGTAVVSVLQLIKSFTRPAAKGGKRLPRGLIALLNNGEEDYLNGARAFAVHPIAQLPQPRPRSSNSPSALDTFLNLEGAGAGGRATLFRSTDAEVTKFYQRAKRSFGTVISGDGFKMGFIRSQTDYKVFTEDLGMRGLDVAFYQPRSRYHTTDDDVRHSSKRSLWHMLGSSLGTLQAMLGDTSTTFDPEDGSPGKGHSAVWFDLFGRSFAVFRLHTAFAWTITLIVAPFVGILVTMYALSHAKKLYFFSNTPLFPTPLDHSGAATTIRGWRGFFNFPVAFVSASGAVIGMAFLFNKVNPMIVYSSQYSVWASFLATWWSIAWLILRGADETKPSALARGYAWIHQWILWLVIMIVVAVSMGQAGLAGGYWVLVFYTGAFLSAWISLLELYALSKKGVEGEVTGDVEPRPYSSEGHSQIAASSDNQSQNQDDDDEHADEETPLFRGRGWPSTFTYSRNHRHETRADDDASEFLDDVYRREQGWSKDLPDWAWILQFLLAVPLQIIFLGPIALLIATALSQTGADGGGTLGTHLAIGIFSIFLLLPIGPFFHRVTYHISTFFLIVLIGTGIYNLVAFPFSPNARLKVYFQQTVDLQTGDNLVHLVGHPNYIERIVSDYIPSAKGQPVVCAPDTSRGGLRRCSWKGTPPNVVSVTAGAANGMADWIFYNITKLEDGKAKISLAGKNTRACKLIFHKPVINIEVLNGHWEETQNGNLSEITMHDKKSSKTHKSPTLGNPIPTHGTKELRLWSRDWERGWDVEVSWEKADSTSPTPPDRHASENAVHIELMAAKRTVQADSKDDDPSKGGLDGRVVCLWSDANRDTEEIPALEEVRKYLPVWAIVSKLADGLVEGSVPFMI